MMRVPRVTRSVGACTRRVFPPCGSLKSSGVQSVGDTLGCEIDSGIVPCNNRCQASFLIARVESFALWTPRMKIRPCDLAQLPLRRRGGSSFLAYSIL